MRVFSRSLSLAASLTFAVAGTASAQGAGHFSLTSPDLTPGGPIPTRNVANVMGCPGQNVAPALKWSAAPERPKSCV